MTNKKESKYQSRIIIGFALVLIGVMGIIISVKTPADGTEGMSKSTVTETKMSAEIQYPLDINTATVEELMTIDGIGEKKAELIVMYREEIGAYTSLEQLKNIKGIDDATVKALSGYLKV